MQVEPLPESASDVIADIAYRMAGLPGMRISTWGGGCNTGYAPEVSRSLVINWSEPRSGL